MRSGHDKESRNGRDVKIDILDDYIRSSERFRVIRVFFGVPESYGNSGKERKEKKRWPHPSSPNWTREGGAPFFPSPSLFPFLLSYSPYMEGLLVGLGKGESYSRWE